MTTPTETPTPRTYAFSNQVRGLGTGYYQAIEFAAGLEKELTAATAQLVEARRQNGNLVLFVTKHHGAKAAIDAAMQQKEAK